MQFTARSKLVGNDLLDRAGGLLAQTAPPTQVGQSNLQLLEVAVGLELREHLVGGLGWVDARGPDLDVELVHLLIRQHALVMDGAVDNVQFESIEDRLDGWGKDDDVCAGQWSVDGCGKGPVRQ
ncbi:Uu.00g052040.m01.CDS01 [Anthostomella pinea]|uniref:Uu.00g052040.m01.CDS01 n=1 Tax=Anthostomella pinea TaxID=933095 RepID=A0AAI8VW61_9PEZI|nr:Uu.00g052040.m01.CDS01 [Anthostomella pinea]